MQAVITQLDQAIYSHDQWYESSTAGFFREHPAFVSLGKAHAIMHDCARALCQRVAEGLPVPLGSWDQFDDEVDKMRLEFQALRQEFTEMAHNRDPLSEAQNRSSLLSELRAQHALITRDGQPCSLVMIDLDHFKWVNDEQGHAAGDAVLVSIVQCLKTLLRPYDRIYRYGGEEFLLCMLGTTPDQARQVAERMRASVASQEVRLNKSGQELFVTASFGVAPLLQSRTVEESIDHADKAMYEAKMAGRDHVVVESRH